MVVSIWRIDQLEKFVLSLDDRKRRQKGDHVSLKYEKGGGGVVQVVVLGDCALSIVSTVADSDSDNYRLPVAVSKEKDLWHFVGFSVGISRMWLRHVSQ